MSKLGVILSSSASLAFAVEHMLESFERHAARQAADDGILVLHAESLKMEPYERAMFFTQLKRDMDSRDLHKTRRKPRLADELKIRFGQ